MCGRYVQKRDAITKAPGRMAKGFLGFQKDKVTITLAFPRKQELKDFNDSEEGTGLVQG